MAALDLDYDLPALRAKALRLARGASVADDVPPERAALVKSARQRFCRVALSHKKSVNAVAESLDCDWHSINDTKENIGGIAVPWWLEKWLEQDPELVAAFAVTLIEDADKAIAAREKAGHG